jgi:hypothetical protein
MAEGAAERERVSGADGAVLPAAGLSAGRVASDFDGADVDEGLVSLCEQPAAATTATIAAARNAFAFARIVSPRSKHVPPA